MLHRVEGFGLSHFRYSAYQGTICARDRASVGSLAWYIAKQEPTSSHQIMGNIEPYNLLSEPSFHFIFHVLLDFHSHMENIDCCLSNPEP